MFTKCGGESEISAYSDNFARPQLDEIIKTYMCMCVLGHTKTSVLCSWNESTW